MKDTSKMERKMVKVFPHFLRAITHCLSVPSFQVSISSRMETYMKDIGSKERETIKVSS